MDASTVFQRMTWAALLAVGLTSGAIAADAPPSTVKLVSAGAEPQQVFVYKFTPGLFAHYSNEQTQVLKTEFDQGNQQVVNQIAEQKSFRVISVGADGSAVLEPMLRKVRLSATFDNLEPTVYNSENVDQPVPPKFANIANTVGRPISRMTFAPNGQLLKITPLQGATAELSEIASKADPTASFLIAFPTEPIGAGATWQEKFSVPVKLTNTGVAPPVAIKREYQLVKREGSLATISLRTSPLTPLKDTPQIEAAVLTRLLSGTIEFDTSLGLIVSQHTKAAGRVVEAFGPKTAMTSSIETKEKRIEAPEGVQPATLKEIGAAP